LKGEKAQTDQYLRNISRAKGWLGATDTALNRLTKLMSQARDIALSGASDTLGTDERKRLSEQVDTLLQEAQQVANTSHEGKYLFAGRQLTGDLPFDITRVPVYVGDSNLVNIEIDKGIKLPVNVLQSEVLIGGTPVIEKALATLGAVKTQLEGGNRLTTAQFDDVTSTLNGFVEVRGAAGARMTRLEASESAHTDNQVNVATSLSREQDTDVAEVVSKLLMQENVYKAALAAGARAIQPNLLDYLR
jgi:flagellar hook-associated protein 3 FlgL